MKNLISQKEYNALFDIRGMPENVHLMIYSSKTERNKKTGKIQHILEGNDENFEELLELINEEIV